MFLLVSLNNAILKILLQKLIKFKIKYKYKCNILIELKMIKLLNLSTLEVTLAMYIILFT
jgi:hypothetical protein